MADIEGFCNGFLSRTFKSKCKYSLTNNAENYRFLFQTQSYLGAEYRWSIWTASLSVQYTSSIMDCDNTLTRLRSSGYTTLKQEVGHTLNRQFFVSQARNL